MKYYPRDYVHDRSYNRDIFITSINTFMKTHFLSVEDLVKLTDIDTEVIQNLMNNKLDKVSMADYKKLLSNLYYEDVFDNSFTLTEKADRTTNIKWSN